MMPYNDLRYGCWSYKHKSLGFTRLRSFTILLYMKQSPCHKFNFGYSTVKQISKFKITGKLTNEYKTKTAWWKWWRAWSALGHIVAQHDCKYQTCLGWYVSSYTKLNASYWHSWWVGLSLQSSRIQYWCSHVSVKRAQHFDLKKQHMSHKELCLGIGHKHA